MIAINNMSMPKSCEDCRCTFNGFDGSTECKLGAKSVDWLKRPKDCPLAEIERPQDECEKCAFEHTEKCDICVHRLYRFGSKSTIPERPKGEWGKWIIAEIQCPNCFEYFETDCYSTEELNNCPNCGAELK